MHEFRRISIRLSCAALIAFFWPFIAVGCALAYRTARVGTTFRVVVSDRGRPVPALRLQLEPSHTDSKNSRQRDVRYVRTDAKGYARFTDLALGSYFLSPDHDAQGADSISVDVVPNGATNKTVALTWPYDTPLRVRSVSGTLLVTDYYPQQTQAQISLSLVEGISGRAIQETLADKKGRFAFDGPVGDGVYFVRVRDAVDKTDEGAITIEVSRNAKEDGLDVYLMWTDCGLTYQRRRSYPELATGRVCGDVADVVGQAINNARIWLLSTDQGAQIPEATRTDAKGHFVLPEQRDGTYQLVVLSRGFVPFVRVVRIEGAELSDRCQSPISVQLGAP
jgi:hypothetical protein